MIFVSVGTQFPFDRIISAIDGWAERVGNVEVVAQVGRSTYQPRAIRTFAFLKAPEFKKFQDEAEFHVAHAGMGSILTALELGKPIVIMPRDHLRGEHRNGHQMATARRFLDTAGVHVAMDVDSLTACLDELNTLSKEAPMPPVTAAALTQRLKNFIADDTQVRVGWRSRLLGGGMRI